MSSVLAQRLAAITGFLAVALGAFGAHGLQKVLSLHNSVETWNTAVLYHLTHAVVLLILAQRSVVPKVAFWSFLIGILMFSGSLYSLALVKVGWLGPITPLGGVGLLLGWLLLLRARPQS